MVELIDDRSEILRARGLKIAHLNVASILGAHKFNMLKLQVEGRQLDIFCASETWLTMGIPEALIEIKGYNIARLDRKWKNTNGDSMAKRGGGLVCYAKQDITMNEFRYENLNYSSRDLEMQ